MMDDRGPPPRPGRGGWERGRGGYRGSRGRGSGYFSDTRSDVGARRPRSRSPRQDDRFPLNDRRPYETDTKPPPLRPFSSVGQTNPRGCDQSPPPQAPEVPAFGTVQNNSIPNGPGQHSGSIPATPVAIPTGPRYQSGKIRRTETEHIWEAINTPAAPQPPSGPSIPTGPRQSPVFQTRRWHSQEPHDKQYGSYHNGPQSQSRPASRDGVANAKKVESPVQQQQQQQRIELDVEMMEAGEVDETPQEVCQPTPPSAPKVETITLVKRPTGVDMSFLDKQSDSDLEDDLGPEYFEGEIEAVKNEIRNASLNNVQLPTEGQSNDAFFKYDVLVCNFNDELRTPNIPSPLPAIMPPEVKVEKVDTPRPELEAMQIDDVPPVPATPAAQAPEQSPQVRIEVQMSTPQPLRPGTSTPSNELADLAGMTIGTPNDKQKSPPKSKLKMAQDVEEVGEESAEEEVQILEAVRKRMVTPDISSLPFRPASPSKGIEPFEEDIEYVDDVMDYIVDDLRLKQQEREEDIKRYQEEYKRLYKKWILFHHSNDELAVKVRQRWEANRAAEVSRAASVAPEKDSKPEGRSRGRFATEHDMERILKISELEAREEKARSDRAAKAKLADQREAVIPDMLSPEERENQRYGDYTNLVSPERALAVFEVLPPMPDFTDHERNVFEATMLEYPKQWGKVANQLPGRNYKHVIQYYYLVKHELKLKEKLKRGLKGRRKKKPKTSVHTVALGRDDDPEDPPPVIEEGGTRRRPRRAAAPTFGGNNQPETAAPSESEGATPAPTSRRGVGTPKGDANGDTPAPKRRAKKQATEKAAKQSKNTQLIAAATSNAQKNREETKVPAPIPLKMQDWGLPRQGPPEPEQIAFQQHLPLGGFDSSPAGRPQRPASHTPPTSMVDRPPPQIAPYEVPNYRAQQDTLSSTLPMNAYDQQTPRTMISANNGAPTSSYWSVSEAESFPALLKHFGTDWHGIAKWMASKTHIMVYTTVFSDWMNVPADSNKSRRVANLAEQVKNYYQRQVDQGGKPEWEAIAREADAKRERGESTGPPPMPSHNPVKRKYDGLPGDSPSRAGQGPPGMNPEDLEELWGNGPAQQQPPLKFGGMPGTGRFDSFTPLPSHAGTLGTFEIDTKRIASHQHSIGHDPSPQPGASRFQTLAQQGGQMADARSAPPTQKILPHQPQAQHLPQQMQQQQPGPQRGYFNVNPTDRRPILQARSSHTSVTSHGSPHPESSAHRIQAAKAVEEAHAERERAQRIMDAAAEREQTLSQGMGAGLASGGMAPGGARMPMKVEPDIQSQAGLTLHSSPHVRDQAGGGGMFEHQTAQQQQAMLAQRQQQQQQQMGGMRQEGSHSQPISPMRALPLSREQQMQGFGQLFRGHQPGQQTQQGQGQGQGQILVPGMDQRGMGSKAKTQGVTTGPSTPIIAAHAPITQGPIAQGQAMRHNTISAPPQQQQQPHVHAHHHHVHQHGMQSRHPSQQGQMLQGQPGGLQPQHQQQGPPAQMAQLQQQQQMKGQTIHPQDQRQQAQSQPPPPRDLAPARKSNVFSLLNDDDEPAPASSQPMPSPSPVPFTGAGQQVYAPSSRITVATPTAQMAGQMAGGREQQPPHILRREPSHSDIRQQDPRAGPPPQDMRQQDPRKAQGPPQDMRGEGMRQENMRPEPPRRDTMPTYAPGPEQQQQKRIRVPNPMAQPPHPQVQAPAPQAPRSHAGSHAGSPMERPLDVRDDRGIMRDREPPRDPRDVRDARDGRDPREHEPRIPFKDDRERQNYYRYQEHMNMVGEDQRRQMMVQQQRQEAEKYHQQRQDAENQRVKIPGHPNSHAPGSHGSQSAVNSPQVVAYQPHASQMPQQQGPPQQQGHRQMFGREQLSHGSRHSSFDGRERGMQTQVIASQGPAPTSGYVTSHSGQPQHPSEQRGFPPQQGGPPPQSGQQRFDGPPRDGPSSGTFGNRQPVDGRNVIVNAKAVANNQYAPVYATREQLDAQVAREQRQARGEPPQLEQRDSRDVLPDPRDPRTLMAQDPRDLRSMPHQQTRDGRDIDPRDPRNIQQPPRDTRDPRDPRDIPQPSREMPQQIQGQGRTYTPNPMVHPVTGDGRPPPGPPLGGPDARGLGAQGGFGEGRGVPVFGFQGSAEEMRERERLLERERQAEMEVNARLAREAQGDPRFGRR